MSLVAMIFIKDRVLMQAQNSPETSMADVIRYRLLLMTQAAGAVLVAAVLLAAASPAHADDMIQAVSFAITGRDGSTVDVVDKKNCVFRMGARTYFLNNIMTNSITFQPFTRQIGNYTRVGIHGKSKVMEEVYQGAAQPVTDYELMVESPDHARIVRAWQYIYAHGCKGMTSPF
jgi:hypothetical protein